MKILEWHQKMMTFEQSTPDSITLPFDPTKILLVPFESLGDILQLNMLKMNGELQSALYNQQYQ